VIPPFGTPAQAQQNDPPISGGDFWIYRGGQYVEYSRRGNLIYELLPTSQIDWDIDEYGNYVEDGVYIAGWTDFGAGGEFGCSPDGVIFQPTSDPGQVNAYRPRADFVGILSLAIIVDDFGLYYDDDPVTTNPPKKVTVWEFTISDSCSDSWRPQFNTDLTYTADIDPAVDHHGNPMEGVIEFRLEGVSQEPGYCLNATQMDDIWHFHYWYHTGSADIDLKFFPANQQPWPNMNVWSSSWGHGDNYDRAATTEPVNIAQAKLRCFDYGAFGYIQAVTSLPFTPQPIVARLAGTLPEDSIFGDGIPTDKEPAGGNMVADVWDNANGAKQGGWDEENNPQTGDNAAHDNFKGDGYTYYEEYRGLEVDGARTAVVPARKEVFVYDEDNLDVVDYLDSGLKVFVSHTDTEMTGDNVVNMFRDTSNHPELHLAEPQHGLWLVNGDNNSFCTQDPNNLGSAAGGDHRAIRLKSSFALRIIKGFGAAEPRHA
jgi:hypothetical protein